jgi:hypothetical protein
MRRVLLLGVFALVLVFTMASPALVFAQSIPTIDWLDQFGPSSGDNAYSVAVDGAGNCYVTGYTAGTLTGQAHLGGYDAFVRKYDKWGNILWTSQFGTSVKDIAHDIAVDMAGNAYVAGRTNGIFTDQTSSGGYDAFVRKYDKWGNVLWTSQFGTNSKDYAYGVAVDIKGNAYATGYTEGSFLGYTNSGGMDVFVRKYDKLGDVMWTKQFGTGADDSAGGIAADVLGNVYVAGWTEGTLPGQTNLGERDAYLRKYDSSGGELWTHQFGTSVEDGAGRLAIDMSGNIYVNGNTMGTLEGQVSSGDYDAFVKKYDKLGNVLWMCQYGTDEYDYCNDLSVDGLGNVYQSGYTYGYFNGFTNSGGRDIYMRKYDKLGNLKWTSQFGTTGEEQAFGIAVHKGGNIIYLGGYTTGTLPGQTLTQGDDAFIAKLIR